MLPAEQNTHRSHLRKLIRMSKGVGTTHSAQKHAPDSMPRAAHESMASCGRVIACLFNLCFMFVIVCFWSRADSFCLRAHRVTAACETPIRPEQTHRRSATGLATWRGDCAEGYYANYTVLYYTLLTILYYTILYYTIKYHSTLHYSTLHSTSYPSVPPGVGDRPDHVG